MEYYNLLEFEVTGTELGDTSKVVAISDSKEKLAEHCKKVYNVEVKTLSRGDYGSPIPSGYETYYVILKTNVVIV
jgi:hypothetical protein